VPEGGGTTTGHEHPGGNRILIAGIVAIAVLFALVATVLHHGSSATFIGFQWWQLVLIAGILGLSGLISGLAGFGFSAIGSSCLLLIPPTLAVPLLMALSAANQFLSIGQLRADMPKTWKEVWPNGYGPYVLGGILGVPFGIWVLNHLPAAKLMLVFGGDSRRIFCVLATETLELEDERLGWLGKWRHRGIDRWSGRRFYCFFGCCGRGLDRLAGHPETTSQIDRAAVHYCAAISVAGDECLRTSFDLYKTILDPARNYFASCSAKHSRRCCALPAHF
jgi:hypothetical protein